MTRLESQGRRLLVSGLLANRTTEEGSPIREQAIGWMTAGPLPLEQPFPMNMTCGALKK